MSRWIAGRRSTLHETYASLHAHGAIREHFLAKILGVHQAITINDFTPILQVLDCLL